MKKILVLFILILSAGTAFAKNVQVECLNSYNSQTETNEFNAKVLKDVSFNSGLKFKKNDIVKMRVIDIISAKSLSRSGYIVVKPVSFIEEIPAETENGSILQEKQIQIHDTTLEGKTTNLKVVTKEGIKENLHDNWKDDLKKAGKGVTKTVVNTTLPGAEQAFQISKGLIKPDEGKTRLQTAANNLVDDSPLKRLKKGTDINIKKGDKIVLKFYHSDVPKWRFIKRNG